jgi:hypothetical protein
MKIRTAGIAVAAGAFALAACSKMAPPAATSTPASSATAAGVAAAADAAPAASDEKLAWLAGEWCGKDDTQVLEETWFSPQKDEMLGMSRTLQGGRMISFEYMRVMNLDGTITLVAQPGGDAPANFKRSDGGADWIRFENKEHDYPTRIEYRRKGEGLHAEIAGPGAPGKEEVIPYEYTRCPAK